MKLRQILLDAPDRESRLESLCGRSASASASAEVEASVRQILGAVRSRGDDAVREYTEKFDGRAPDASGSYEIPAARWRERAASVDEAVARALEAASRRIRRFHEHQVQGEGYVLEEDGARLGLRVLPLARVGIYVPGGTALYPSSVLMTAIPAKVAGVGEIVMVTPGASPEALLAALSSGVDRVFEIGGAQAIAALAYGTATIPRVDKIVGPGNQWVAEAKRMVYGDVDIDSIAGPSEVLVVADDGADPHCVAADLLAQAEHDVEARPILVTTSGALVGAVERALEEQLRDLPRREIATRSVSRHGVAVVVASLDEAIALAERYAPEHLELQLREARTVAARIRNAGAIFVGPYTPEAAGDYMAGPNHVLPTGGAARYASPLGVYDFLKRVSIIEYGRDTLSAQRQTIVELAEVEGLHAHARSVEARFASDGGDAARPSAATLREPEAGDD